MLTQLRLRNYRCFREATITLSPLTVLVGPNSSGKSSLLMALRPNQTNLYRPEDVWRHEIGGEWEVVQSFTDQTEARYHFHHQVWSLHRRDFTHQLLHLDINKLRDPNQVQQAVQLAPDGSNLSNAYATLTRKQQDKVAEQLGDLVPSFKDLAIRPTSQGQHQLRFQDRWNESVWYPPNEVSDGTMLVTAYVLLQHQSPPVDLIAIEEPERGLHPYLLGELVSLWRKMTRGEVGPRPVQIVLATHSAELLDHVEPSEVRFLRRDATSGAVIVENAPDDNEDWRSAYRTYQDSLGSMWLSGSLGGVPGV